MTTTTLTRQEKINERKHSRERLTAMLTPGDTVYTMVRSVSSSGMSRTMSLYIVKDNRLVNITYYAAHALEWPLVEKNGSRVLRVGGCGMDMGFHTVYTLSRVLFAATMPSGDAGYALKQEWI
jgi:hypothetical protein